MRAREEKDIAEQRQMLEMLREKEKQDMIKQQQLQQRLQQQNHGSIFFIMSHIVYFDVKSICCNEAQTERDSISGTQ